MKPYISLWPAELASVGIPVWGDNLIIDPASKACPIVEAKPRRGVVLASLPKTPASGTSMRVLIKAVTQLRLQLTEQCLAGPLDPTRTDDIAVQLKTALEQYRSILDYLARDIYGLCVSSPQAGKPKKLYFPNAGPNESEVEFRRRFQKEFPQLSLTIPCLFKHILEIQRFSGEKWLHNLVTLVNPMKHHRLAEWEEINCKSLIIHYDLVGIRLGELGLRSVRIPQGKEIRFRSPSGAECALRGPQEITIDTVALSHADPELQMDHVTWKTTAVIGTGRSVAGLLAEIDGGIRMACVYVTRGA